MVRFLLATVLLSLTPAAGWARAHQQPAPPKPGGITPTNQERVDLPPPALLGFRAHVARMEHPVAGTVVIVADPASYLAALGRWSPKLRFPVLIDDGTPAAAEDIARFVRAFSPSGVVRWAAPNADAKAPWTDGKAEDRQSALDRVVLDASGIAPGENHDLDAPALWRKTQAPGIVLTSAKDPAWTAAVALAAGHGQPLLYADVPGDLTTVMTSGQADDLERAIEARCEALGLMWKGLGDSIDAVTLCLNCPVKYATLGNDVNALTDRIGRRAADKEFPRWAWAGQVFGTPAQACYRAMCSLFLTPRSAWLFDGYPNTAPWTTYDATAAAEPLKKRGLAVTIDDTPKQSARDWRLRAARPIDAGLILVNTKGNSDFFELEPGICRPQDAPVLLKPAAVALVHSWSAQWPARRDTVAGRWLERGAYCYVGSVQEPYLQAFVPTPTLATRLAGGAAWGAAVRVDNGQPWRVAVFGDPLMLLVPGREHEKLDIPLEGSVRLTDDLGAELKAGHYAAGIRLLTMLGRDDDVRTLVDAMLSAKKKELTPEVAAAAMLPIFRAGGGASLPALVKTIPASTTIDPAALDALWLFAFASLDTGGDDSLLAALRDHLRPDSLERDATELGRMWSIRTSATAAVGVLEAARDARTDPSEKAAIDRAIKAIRR